MAKKTQALTKYDAELAKYAQAARGIEKNVGGGNFISLRGGRMQYQGAEVPGNKMNVIIVDHILENDFYEGAYDPDNPTSPICYAFGRDEDEMAPHEQAGEPQNDNCHDCDKNEWGTADIGRGKACKNSRRLALVTEGDMQELENAEIAYLKVPVTSVKAWAGYVRQLADVMNKPPFAVVTEVELVPSQKNQFELQFSCVQEIEDADAIGALVELHEKVEKEIAFPYPLVQIDKAPARGRGARQAAAPARAGRQPAARQQPAAPAARGRSRVAAKPAPAPAAAAPARRQSRVTVGVQKQPTPRRY